MPRLANTAKLLYTVYVGITIVAVLSLVLTGIPCLTRCCSVLAR